QFTPFDSDDAHLIALVTQRGGLLQHSRIVRSVVVHEHGDPWIPHAWVRRHAWSVLERSARGCPRRPRQCRGVPNGADRWLLWSTLTVPVLRYVRLVDRRGREEEIALGRSCPSWARARSSSSSPRSPMRRRSRAMSST